MKLIKPSVEILPQGEGLEGIYKHIEYAGRTCYKSHDKITPDSAKEFVDRMIKSGHGAMLEHGTVYLKVLSGNKFRDGAFGNFNQVFSDNLYYKLNSDNEGTLYITTNFRYIIENHLEHWLQYLCEPTEHHEKRVTIKFITDQGILREFTRHRVFSFACESTRYCNYSKNKYDNEITFIEPCWNIEGTDGYIFKLALEDAERRYMQLIEEGWKPQQARNVLPLATKCELIMTGFKSDWDHFFFLRCPISAHPQARELAIQLKELMS